MQLQEAKDQFVQAWGKQASAWGINRTMGLIHGLLITSKEPLSTDDLMEILGISRGNANMNVRALIDWGLVHKETLDGERKEYFVAEKDSWLMAKKIIEQRRKQEIEPMLALFDSLKEIDDNSQDAKDFKKDLKSMQKLSSRVDKALGRLVKIGDAKIVNTIAKMLKQQ